MRVLAQDAPRALIRPEREAYNHREANFVHEDCVGEAFARSGGYKPLRELVDVFFSSREHRATYDVSDVVGTDAGEHARGAVPHIECRLLDMEHSP